MRLDISRFRLSAPGVVVTLASLLMTGTAFTGCSGDDDDDASIPGDDDDSPGETPTGDDDDATGDDDDATGDDDDTSPPPAGSEHCGQIDASQTWAAADSPHLVTCDVYIQGDSAPVVVIEPGATVRFAAGTGLYLAYDGTPGALMAEGTEDEPIVFTSAAAQTAGAWSGISIAAQSTNSRFAHATIRYAGGAFLSGALVVNDATVQVRQVTLQDSEEHGFTLTGGASFTGTSEDLTVTGCDGYAGQIDAAQAHTVPTGEYTGNTLDAIELVAGLVEESATWADHGVPWSASEDLYVQGENAPVLTLEPGVVLNFQSGTGLYLAYDGNPGGLLAEGTEEAPVVLGSAGSSQAGFWSGVSIAEETVTASLADLRIENAGGAFLAGALVVDGATVTVQRVVIEDSEDDGFQLTSGAAFGEGSADLTVTGSGGHVGRIDAGQASSLPSGAYDGNGIDAIQLGAGLVDTSVTWIDRGVPLHATEDLFVQGPTGPVLTLDAGLELGFESGVGLYVAYDGDAGGLRLEGTEEAPVVLTAAGTAQAGFWSGISLADETLDEETVFTHFVIEYGGGAFLRANLELSDASPTLSDGELNDSEEYGLCADPASAPSLTDVTFDGNQLGPTCPTDE